MSGQKKAGPCGQVNDFSPHVSLSSSLSYVVLEGHLGAPEAKNQILSLGVFSVLLP